mmetsp:Transcript_1331/g.4382  ORF Transcript_1331/g.4382 Transcript_1331/m.4382 type:complete len:310 (+) Transcript_1331:221-1150(+)|eukprot:CAMPEP_0206294402 /NCGR_PEP_ID=MMETSP0106_2-20121207/4640_1 /ASSEMBLY_ACC=CAM_ASM_000206 /TAXON_ID=81532 /ORGANISM="Acanthoeca-like sp., Strain 10tr" /LENGTH=309 /DNA_ID=CAMNT_0053725039 /DNA_START=99 /DNA_END=1028 /DNA_ORIENTATION=+
MLAPALAAAVIMSTARFASAEDSLYCGLRTSCYDVLGVSRESTTAEIRRAYRKLSLKYHPDRGGDEEDFFKIATAYESLSDEESRNNHDYYLDHPEEHAYNMYRYYKHKAAPKIGLMPIFLAVMTIISTCQWLYWSQRHSQAMGYALESKEIRQRAKTMAQEQGLLQGVKSKKDEERILRDVVVSNLDLQGSYAPPALKDIAWVKLLMLPYTVSRYLWWLGNWYYRIHVCGQELTDDDREYLILRNVGWSKQRWECAEETVKDEMWEAELWDYPKCVAFIRAKEEAEMDKWRNTARYKRYKRWQKREGR